MALLFRLHLWPRMILELDKTGSGKSKIELAGIGYWCSLPLKLVIWPVGFCLDPIEDLLEKKNLCGLELG